MAGTPDCLWLGSGSVSRPTNDRFFTKSSTCSFMYNRVPCALPHKFLGKWTGIEGSQIDVLCQAMQSPPARYFAYVDSWVLSGTNVLTISSVTWRLNFTGSGSWRPSDSSAWPCKTSTHSTRTGLSSLSVC